MAKRTKRGTAGGIHVKTTGSEHNSLVGRKRKRKTMIMNNEARQDNIIYINESDGGLILIRESYTGGRSPLSLFMGLGS